MLPCGYTFVLGEGKEGGGWRERTERGGVLRAEGGGKHATWQGQRVARDSWCWYVGFVGSKQVSPGLATAGAAAASPSVGPAPAQTIF